MIEISGDVVKQSSLIYSGEWYLYISTVYANVSMELDWKI